MTSVLDLIATCGLYCGACSFKLAFDENDRAHVRAMPPRYDQAKEAELETCPGCRGEATACGVDPCKIRACARIRELTHCGLCAEFPCSVLSAFAHDGVPHHGETLGNLDGLRKVGASTWLAEQVARWTCACGARRSWYLRKCPRCGNALEGPL
jgi:hypothetical protein